MLQPILLEIIIQLEPRVEFPQVPERRDAAWVVGGEGGAAQALAEDAVAETGVGGVEGGVEDEGLGFEEVEEAGAGDCHGCGVVMSRR